MPRSAAKRSTTSNIRAPHDRLAGLDLREIEQVVDQLGSSLGGLVGCNATCSCCSVVSGPSAWSSSSRDSARIEFSGVRNSWLMLDRKRDFSSSARRRWSARSSSSA